MKDDVCQPNADCQAHDRMAAHVTVVYSGRFRCSRCGFSWEVGAIPYYSVREWGDAKKQSGPRAVESEPHVVFYKKPGGRGGS